MCTQKYAIEIVYGDLVPAPFFFFSLPFPKNWLLGLRTIVAKVKDTVANWYFWLVGTLYVCTFCSFKKKNFFHGVFFISVIFPPPPSPPPPLRAVTNLQPIGDLLSSVSREVVLKEGDGLTLGLSESMMAFFTLPGPFVGTYMYMHMYAYMYVHTYAHTYTHTCTYVYTYVHTYVHTYVCMHIRTHTHTYVRTYVHTY